MSHPHTRMDKPTAEYYCFVRSMIMTEFPCPPLPVAGHRTEDSERAVLNSHDMISTLMITALKMQDTGFNERRRVRQEQLETQYRQELERAKTFEDTYAAMAAFTQQYIQSYLLHNIHPMDIRVLPIDHATPALRKQIQSFANATAILEDAPPPPEDLSDHGLRSSIAGCARLIIAPSTAY